MNEVIASEVIATRLAEALLASMTAGDDQLDKALQDLYPHLVRHLDRRPAAAEEPLSRALERLRITTAARWMHRKRKPEEPRICRA